MASRQTDLPTAPPRQTFLQLCLLVLLLVFKAESGAAQPAPPVSVPGFEAVHEPLTAPLDLPAGPAADRSVAAVAAPVRTGAGTPAPEGLAPDLGKDAAFDRDVPVGEAVVPVVRPAAVVAAQGRAQRYGQGVFAGMMGALLLYNLFLYLSIRDRSYLYYVFFLLVSTFFWMVHYGYLQAWYGPQGWHAHPPLLLYTIVLGVVLYLCFARSFLQVGPAAPRLDGLMRLVIVAQGGAVLLSLAGYRLAAQHAMVWSVIAALLTAFIVALVQWRAGYRPARFFLAASIAFILGALLYAVAGFGLLPKTFVTIHSPQIGALLEALLLSLGLADRISVLQQERQQALAAVQVAEAHSAALRETDELKTQLLNLAAHDLRSPLMGIHGFAVMLRAEVEPAAEIQEPLTMIETASRQMLTLIEDLLNTVAIESGHLRLRLAPVRLGEVAEEVVRAYRPRAALKDQRIAFTASIAVEAQADVGRLREAMDNLVSNAVKYSPRSSGIEVVVEPVDGQARFCVRDQGPGLTEEDRTRVFGYYQRLSAAPTGNEPSTGLGLALTKRLIELQGGRIWVESAPGKGSRFGFDLPLATAAAARVAA